MTFSLPIPGRSAGTSLVERSFLPRFIKLDVMLASILLGPLAVLEVAGRTPSLYWIDITVAIFAVLSLAKICARPSDLSFRLPPAMLWGMAYVLICAASILLTEDPLVSIATLKLRVMPIAVFLLACRQAKTRADIDHFFKTLIWFGCALAAISLYNWYRFSLGALVLSDEFGPKDMLQLSFGRSNYLASMFVLLIPTMIAFVKERRARPSFLLYLGALLIVSVALLFTQSRGSLISLAFGLTAWAFFGLARAFSAQKVLRTMLAAVAIVVIAALVWQKIPEEVRVDLSTAFGLLWYDASRGNFGGGRTELWVAAIKGAWQSNLFGIGLGNQAILYSKAQMTQSAHSLYLETLLETGIVGFIALLGILHAFGRTLWRLWKISPLSDRPLVGAMLATFVTSLVNVSQEPSFWGPQYSCLFWMIMGIAYSWRRMHLAARSSLAAIGI